MKIGLVLGGASVTEAIRNVEGAAEAGFESGWFANIFGVDAIMAIALAGRSQPGITLGTAVVPTFPRHPHAMAQQAMTAWDATDGRFVLGIGLSHQIVIETMFGLDFARPAVHMREYLQVLMPLLREGTAGFDGERYRVHATLDRSRDDGGPPVLVAALGPAMLRVAGELADGTVLWMTGERTIADHIVPRITEAATAAGRPAPAVQAGFPVAVTNDVDAARTQAAATFSIYGQLPSYRAMLDREGAAGPADVAIVGDEDEIARSLARLGEAGVTEFAAACFGDPETIARTTKVLAQLARAT